MNYTAKYFRDSLPEWKRRKDPMVARFFYRPISFFVASWCARHGIMANTVSYFSMLVALSGCICFFFENHLFHIVGAIEFNVWLLLDCVDGNLARCVKKQPFGEFADAASSYILVAFMCLSMSFAIYWEGGWFVPAGWIWIVLMGALASISDTLMRLVYQKYVHGERELIDKGLLQAEKDVFKDHAQVNSFTVWMVETMGIGGILPMMIFFGVLLHALDVVLVYCFVYYWGSSTTMILKYLRKAIKKTQEIENFEKRGTYL